MNAISKAVSYTLKTEFNDNYNMKDQSNSVSWHLSELIILLSELQTNANKDYSPYIKSVFHKINMMLMDDAACFFQAVPLCKNARTHSWTMAGMAYMLMVLVNHS